MKLIKEHEFVTNEERRLQEMADRITNVIERYQTDCTRIASECGLDARVIRRMKHAIPVRSDSEARVKLFIEKKYNEII